MWTIRIKELTHFRGKVRRSVIWTQVRRNQDIFMPGWWSPKASVREGAGKRQVKDRQGIKKWDMWLGINFKVQNRIKDQSRQRTHEEKNKSNTDRKLFLWSPLLPGSQSIVSLKADADNCRSESNPVKLGGKKGKIIKRTGGG